MIENNYLIAEFMGDTSVSIHKMEYHVSWDWLIPVVDKCFEVADSAEQCKAIRYALHETDKEYLYRAVVRFIQKNTDTEKMMKMRIADMDNDLN